MKVLSSLYFLIFLTFFSNNTAKQTFLKNTHEFIFTQLNSLQSNELILKSELSAFCFLNVNSNVINLYPNFNNTGDFSQQFPGGENLFMNICKRAFTNCPNRTSSITYKRPGSCISLSGNVNQTSKFRIFYNNRNNSTSILADLPKGDVCLSDPWRNYETTLNFTCNKNNQQIIYDASNFNINNCKNTINVLTPYACAIKSTYGLWKAVDRNKIVIGIILMLTGLFFAFLAQKYVEVTEIMSGIIFTWILIFYVILYNLSIEISNFYLIISFTLTTTAGYILGWFFGKVEKLPSVILSGLAGLIVGNFIYNLILFSLKNFNYKLFLTFIICFILIGVIVSLSWNYYILSISSSIIGSYFIIRGFSFIMGHFPDERQINDLMIFNEFDQVKNLLSHHIFAYFGGFIVIAFSSMFIQIKYFFNKNEDSPRKHILAEILNENQPLCHKTIEN